jgi:hypothetical protein
MRVIIGMLLGAVLTVGGAYVHDSIYASTTTPTPPAASGQRPLVNWDVFNVTARNTSAAANRMWNQLTGK